MRSTTPVSNTRQSHPQRLGDSLPILSLPEVKERLQAIGFVLALSTPEEYDTPYGAIGGLICGENTNSLARFALLAQHERIHIASWPAFASIHQRTAFDSMDIRVRYHAFEGRIFVISAATVLTDDCIKALGLSAEQKATITFRGGHSGIVGPKGNYIAGPADDTEQILYADADMERVIEGKLIHDLTGHYNRFDVFTLLMKRAPRQALQIEETEQSDEQHEFTPEQALVKVR